MTEVFGDDYGSDPSVGVAGAVVSACPDAVIGIDGTGTIVLANPAAESLFGWSPEELIGEPVEVLVPESLRRAHVRHRERFTSEPVTRPMGVGLRLSGRRRDGSEFPIDVGLAPVPTAAGALYVAFVRDVTEQRRSEQRIRAVNELSQALLAGETTDALLAMTARHARQLVSGIAAWVLSSAGPTHMMVVLAGDGTGAESLVGREFPTSGTVAERAMGADDRVVVEDLSRRVPPDNAFGPTLGVALSEGEHRFGTLVVARAIHADMFDQADLASIETFATSVAVALALGEARAELYRLSLIEEHDRIARDLHDTVIQRLFATGMSLQAVHRLAGEPAGARIAQAVDDLDETIREIRTAIFELQRPPVAGRRLRSEVQALVADAARRGGIQPQVRFDGPVDSAGSDAVVVHLLAVLREALSNVVRHARAGALDVEVAAVGSEILLVVMDDGAGLPEMINEGSGLRNMASRAKELGGRFEARSAPGGGTRLEWRVPAAPGAGPSPG